MLGGTFINLLEIAETFENLKTELVKRFAPFNVNTDDLNLVSIVFP